MAHDLGIPLADVYIAETATGECRQRGLGGLGGGGLGRQHTAVSGQPAGRAGSGCCAPASADLHSLPLPCLTPTNTPPCHPGNLRADKVPNASPTAASASSDMYGAAAADAVRQLKERLKPFADTMPGASFKASGWRAGLEAGREGREGRSVPAAPARLGQRWPCCMLCSHSLSNPTPAPLSASASAPLHRRWPTLPILSASTCAPTASTRRPTSQALAASCPSTTSPTVRPGPFSAVFRCVFM